MKGYTKWMQLGSVLVTTRVSFPWVFLRLTSPFYWLLGARNIICRCVDLWTLTMFQQGPGAPGLGNFSSRSSWTRHRHVIHTHTYTHTNLTPRVFLIINPTAESKLTKHCFFWTVCFYYINFYSCTRYFLCFWFQIMNCWIQLQPSIRHFAYKSNAFNHNINHRFKWRSLECFNFIAVF